jgi:hypothetical protein
MPTSVTDMQNMPEKDLGTWYAIWMSIPEPIKAAVMTFALSLIVSIQDKDATLRGVLMRVTVGTTLILMASNGFQAAGMSNGWGYFLGALVGLFGLEQFKVWVKKWTEKTLDVPK